MVTQEKSGVVEVAKLELLLGLKEREALFVKFQKGDIFIFFGFIIVLIIGINVVTMSA